MEKTNWKPCQAQIKLKSLPELWHVSHLRLAVYFPTPVLGQFAMSLVRIWTRKMIAASKVSTIISFFTKTSTALIGSTLYTNPNQFAAAIETKVPSHYLPVFFILLKIFPLIETASNISNIYICYRSYAICQWCVSSQMLDPPLITQV